MAETNIVLEDTEEKASSQEWERKERKERNSSGFHLISHMTTHKRLSLM